jgi:2-octaprenyl-6-methoxyphenol hydroxylase/2-octaprenylphenol hydroxylase
VVDNRAFLDVLRSEIQRSHNIDYFDGTRVDNLQPLQQGMRLQFADDGTTQTLDVPLVVLADGALSEHAAKLGIAHAHHDYGQHALIANVRHTQDHNGCAFERFTEQGPMALLPLQKNGAGHRSALVWTHSNHDIAAALAEPDDMFLRKLQTGFGFRVGRFLRVGERVAFPLHLQFAKEQVRSSLVLMGNAAHYLHPVAGQGFNLTLRDCIELAQTLESAISDKLEIGNVSILQKYLKRRHLDQQLTAKLSHSFIEIFGSTHPLKQISRTVGLLSMNKMPAVSSLFFKQMMGQGAFGNVRS